MAPNKEYFTSFSFRELYVIILIKIIQYNKSKMLIRSSKNNFIFQIIKASTIKINDNLVSNSSKASVDFTLVQKLHTKLAARLHLAHALLPAPRRGRSSTTRLHLLGECPSLEK